MSGNLPDNMLAALLNTAGSDFDMAKAARLISSGQWPVESRYEFEGKNIIELAAANAKISARPLDAIPLFMDLAEAGVSIKASSWTIAPEEIPSAFTRLFLRGMGQGAQPGRLAHACKALAMIQPIKPVKDQAENIAAEIEKAGGYHAPLQGIDLVAWMALHDFPPDAGGCANPYGNDNENTTRMRIRKRVFGHKDIKRETMDRISGLLLDYRVVSVDDKTEKAKMFNASKAEVFIMALDQGAAVDEKLAPMVGVRAYNMLYDMCTVRSSWRKSDMKTSRERIDDLGDAFALVVPLAAQSDDFYPDFSWIMTERPNMIDRLFSDPQTLEKGVRSFMAAALISYGRMDDIAQAVPALHTCLNQCPADDRERIAGIMQDQIHQAKKPGGEREQIIGMLQGVVDGALMHSQTPQVASGPARPAPRL